MRNKPRLTEHFFIRNKSIIYAIYLFFIIAAVVPVILALLYAPIDPDSGYYLAIIERINDGYIPYKDFPMSYTPLVFYIGFLFKKIFSIGINYEVFLFLHFIIQFLSAFIVFRLTKHLTHRNDYGFFAGILFIILSHWNGGNSFLLETPSLFLGLWSIYFTVRFPKNPFYIFISGILVALSFLCKQYGFGFLLLNTFILIHYPKQLKHLLFLFFGFILPLLICFSIWGSYFLSIMYGGGYSGELEFIERIKMLFDRFIFLHLFAPILLVVWLNSYWLLNKKSPNNRYIAMLILGIFGFMLQFMFQPFSHYYLYVIPFVCIIIFTVYTHANRFRTIYKLFIILTFLLSLIATYHFKVNKVYIQKSFVKSNQKTIAKTLSKQIPNHQTLYIANVSLVEQYYLTNLLPPNFKTYGYTFGVALSPQMHLKQMHDADYVLKHISVENEYEIYTNRKYNQLNGRKQINIIKNVSLYY